MWKLTWGELARAVHGSPRPAEYIFIVPILAVSLFLLSLPVVAGFLSRAGPLLWVARILALCLAGTSQYHLDSFVGSRMDSGAHAFSAGMWLMSAGLFVLPKAGPTATASGWKTPALVLAPVALIVWLPWQFPHLFDRYHESQRIWTCRGDIYSHLFQHEEPLAAATMARNGWQSFITRPPDLPSGVPWKPDLLSPPEDPWGHPYHYSREALPQVTRAAIFPQPFISSDGPDGIPGTADDIGERGRSYRYLALPPDP